MGEDRRAGGAVRWLPLLVVLGVLGAVAAVVVGLVVVIGSGDDEPTPTARADPDGPIDGVRTYDGLGRRHVTGTVRYPQAPPVGGDHHPVWLNCGVYAEPVPEVHVVHSLEHGAVWIAYAPDLPAREVALLEDLVTPGSYVVLSPHDAVTDVTVTAWGAQLDLDDATDPRLERFLVRYERAATAPEAGSPCTGGVGSPS